MREFGNPIGPELRERIVEEAEKLFAATKTIRHVKASEFAMELPNDPVLAHEAELRWPEGRIRVAMTVPEARPPFEWVIEITSNIDEGDYFKHYLVRESDIVLAQRKVLTPIDVQEARVILADLAQAHAALQSS